MTILNNFAKLTVLLIDDNPLELGLIRLVLEKNFHNIKCIALTRVPDWESFLQSQKVDVIIIDYRLPDKNGIEHIKDLRKVDKDVYAFLITALEKDEIDQDITNAGATDFIVKDRSYSNLISKLNNVILNESVKQIEDELKSLKFVLNNFSDLVVLKINLKDECIDLLGNVEKFKSLTGIDDLKSGWKKYFEEIYTQLKSEVESSEETLCYKMFELKSFNEVTQLVFCLLKSDHNFYLIIKPI